METYQDRMKKITENGQHMRAALLEPVVDLDSGGFIADKKARAERLEQVTPHTIFEQAGKGAAMIQATASNAVRKYCEERGMAPSNELLASAYQAIENVLSLSGGGEKQVGSLLFESAQMSSTEGIIMRDRLVSLILPIMLMSITSNIVTHIPAGFNQSEIFKIWRTAGSTFGDLTKGERIEYDFSGQYSSMDVRKLAGTGNGSKTGSSDEFEWDSNTVIYSGSGTSVWPMKKKSVRILHDRNIVAKDDGAGNLSGTFVVGSTTITVTGAVNYDTGNINPVFSTAPVNGIEIHVMFDVNIEKDPTLIPTVDHEMDSRVLYPHESAIAAGVTLQALWALRREYNLNADSMAMTALRNILAADKDRKRLNDMYFFMKDERSWSYAVPDGVYFQEYYETLKQTLLTIDSVLMNRTGVSGLVGIVADSLSSVLFRTMREPNFVAAPGYVRRPQPHFVGRLFGMWDLYEDPQGTSYTSLCYAKGANHGEAGYVAGDAVPALTFKHSIQTDLNYKSTLWELAYRDLNPFDGREFFMKLEMTDGES
jgi:hypothetical protein